MPDFWLGTLVITFAAIWFHWIPPIGYASLWDDPLRFDPERWQPAARLERSRFSYFPFSAGSRSCLGEAFASTEGVLCLATIAQAWKFRLTPGAPIALQPQLTLRARNGITMRAERRV